MSGADRIARLVRAALTRAAPVGAAWSGKDGDPAGLRRWGDPDVLLREAELDLAAVAAAGGRFVVPGDDEWPAGVDDLRPSDEPEPFGLWVRGPARLTDIGRRGVAIVGARAATRYGESVAFSMAADLAAAGCTVVSGAAFGIDAAGHRGAISVGGVTAAVLAAGVDVPSPRSHATLIDRVAAAGCVVSELAPGTQPEAKRFLVRNRLIAALSRGVVVVEAAERSGTKSTVRYADGMSRTVMAVPGPVTSPLSRGCHGLVRELNAMLVQDADDVLEALGLSPEPLGPATPHLPATAPCAGNVVAGEPAGSAGLVGLDAGRTGPAAGKAAGPPSPSTVDDSRLPDHQVLAHVTAVASVSTGELAAACDMSHTAVMATLGRLASQGVVVRDGVRWRRR